MHRGDVAYSSRTEVYVHRFSLTLYCLYPSCAKLDNINRRWIIAFHVTAGRNWSVDLYVSQLVIHMHILYTCRYTLFGNSLNKK